ncbi:MAG: hypothetical protein NUV81_02885 [bacterium]|nr:hypothetical protein [bacterium]
MKATVVLIEDGNCILECEDGKRIQLPFFVLEGTPEVGKKVEFRAVVLQAQNAGQIDFAKDLINEILQESES